MKVKKLMAVLLAATLVLGALTACGSDGGDGNSNNDTGQSSVEGGGQSDAGSGEEQVPISEEDYYEIVMAIPTFGSEPAGLAEVEAALNAEVGPALGVKVTLSPMSVFNMSAEQSRMITSGDKLDIVDLVFTGVSSYVSTGSLLALDDLYAQYGADIERAEGVAVTGGYYNGKLYAIPSEEKLARSYGFFARADMVEELGFSYDADTIYTVEDLEELFAAYKAKYGDGYYCIAGITNSVDLFTYFQPIDSLGGATGYGVLMDGGLTGNTTVESQFETEAYAEYARRMYDWAQKGYISADAATNTDGGTTQIQSGFYLGSFSGTETDMTSNMTRDCGYEMIPITLVAPWCQTAMYQTTMWAISATCENPEKTFQFINYMYADNTIDNLLTYGLEGVSYEVVERGEKEGQMVIRYLEGLDATNTPYNSPLHVFGDKTTIAVFEPMTLDYYTMCEEFNNNIPDNRKSISLGYVFDSTPVASQASNVSAVVTQYCGIITAGAEDPATALPKFIKDLKDAGVDDVIAENQRQFDEWLAQQ